MSVYSYIPEDIIVNHIISDIDNINDLVNLYRTNSEYRNIHNNKNVLNLLMRKFTPVYPIYFTLLEKNFI
jgi:hypothetical protein